MSVREYIGARYVPLFADPIEWDDTKSYEPLTIVYHQGNSYTSRQAVPAGIAITNDDYWALTGNYNAQIEAYRAEVQQFSGDIDDLEAIIPASQFTSSSTVKDAIDALDTAFDTRLDAIEANGWVTTSRIDSGAVTTGKIDAGAVTDAKLASDSVTTVKIVDAAVTTAKIADNAITNAKIPANTITKDKIVNDDIFLIFGDSWCETNLYTDWVTPVNDILNCGTVLNYGGGGASFAYNSSNTIAMQIAVANNELTTAQKNNVKYIIIMAGVNDHHPYHATNLYEAIDSALQLCKNTYPNAIIQWFPTSCAPDYDNSTGPKWLHCQSTFWYTIGRFASSSGSTDECNRFAFPSCGTAFYFNSSSPVSAFFDNSKLHLNAYGNHAIVQAILEAYGKLSIPYGYSNAWEQDTGRFIFYSVTPQRVHMSGDFSSRTAATFNNASGERILLALTFDKAHRMYTGNVNPTFQILACTDGNASLIDYVSLKPNSDFTTAIFEPRSGSGTLYLFY